MLLLSIFRRWRLYAQWFSKDEEDPIQSPIASTRSVFFLNIQSHYINNIRYPPWLAVELYRYYGFFALGACGCLLFTEVAK